MKNLFTCIFLFISISVFGQKLSKYTSYTNHFQADYFYKDNQISFDNNGVIKVKNKYNALKIAVFGIFNYEEFLRTGNEEFKTKCINQFIYLGSSDNYDVMDSSRAIGFPYDYNYAGITAPWYSGLTQGVIISYYLRYYDLTNNELALGLAKKACAQMLLPLNKKGALSKTPEGYTWIEEYPKSNKPMVLNGYLSSVTALYEYVEFFKEDKYAKQIYEECLESLKKTLFKFDTPTWTKYNRGGGSIPNNYIKLQINQLTHLYELTGDEQFMLHAALWSVFAYGKDITYYRPGYINKNYDYSIPVILKEKEYIINNSRALNLKEKRTNKNNPNYCHFYSKIDSTTENGFKYKIKAGKKTESIIFYRSSNVKNKIKNKLWLTENTELKNKGKIKPKGKYYQLLVLFKVNEDLPKISKIEIKPIKNKK